MRNVMATLFVGWVGLLATVTPAGAQAGTSTPWLVAPGTTPRAAYTAGDVRRISFGHPRLQPWLEDAAERSPFLRAQLDRLLGHQLLTLSITLVNPAEVPGARAMTVLEPAASGHLHAQVRLCVEANTIELLGHELEHVIEHLDGVRVRRRLRRGDAGVRSSTSHAFETDRAVLAGRRVASEYLRYQQGRLQ